MATSTPQAFVSALPHHRMVIPLLGTTLDKIELPSCIHEILSNTLLLATQHGLPTVVLMYDVLFQLGLPYRNMIVMAKLYSLFDNYFNELRVRGMPIIPMTHQLSNGEEHFDGAFNLDLMEVLMEAHRRYSEDPGLDVIKIDDGAGLATKNPDDTRVFGIVEQTTCGARRLERRQAEHSLNCLCLSIARTPLKTCLEAPVIASTLIYALRERKVLFPNSHKRIGIIGDGVIARAVGELLKRDGYDVVHFDYKQYIIDQVLDGKKLTGGLKKFLINSDIVVSCTGKDCGKIWNTLHIDIAELLHSIKRAANTGPLILVNASSGRNDFDTLIRAMEKEDVRIREQTQARKLDDIHYPFSENPEIIVLRGGYPANFPLDPAKFFQLIRVIKVWAIIELVMAKATGITTKGLFMPDPVCHLFILNEFLKLDLGEYCPEPSAIAKARFELYGQYCQAPPLVPAFRKLFPQPLRPDSCLERPITYIPNFFPPPSSPQKIMSSLSDSPRVPIQQLLVSAVAIEGTGLEMIPESEEKAEQANPPREEEMTSAGLIPVPVSLMSYRPVSLWSDTSLFPERMKLKQIPKDAYTYVLSAVPLCITWAA